METGSNTGLRRLCVVVVSTLLFFSASVAAQSNPKSPKSRPPAKNGSPGASAATLDELAKKAGVARASGNAPEALRLYQQVLKSRPNWTEGWWYVGMIHYDSDEFATAIPALEKVVKLEPRIGSGWAFLGLCKFRVQQYTEALRDLEQAHHLGFGDAATARVGNYHRGLLLNLNGNSDEATSVLAAQFSQEKASAQVAIAMGLALLRMPILPDQLDVTKKELVFNAGQASVELSHKRFADALRQLQAIEKEHPDVTFVHYNAAKALAALSRWEEATAEAENELKLNPKSTDSYVLLSIIYLKQNQTDLALKAAKQAEVLDPKNAQVHHALAECFAAKGDKAEAETEFALAQSLGWKEEASSVSVGATTASNSPPEATSTENDFELLQQKALGAQQEGDQAATVDAYREALKVRPDWAEGILYLATYYYTTEQYGEALKLSHQLTSIQPNVGASWALLGLCEFQAGDYENAYVHLKRGQDLGFPAGGGGAISEANYHIGILLNWKGDFGAAHDLLAQEAKAGPRAADSKYALGINLLRLRALPSQVEERDKPMVITASGIAMDLTRSDYGPATAKFDELLKKYPGRGYIHNAYGWTLMSISRYDAAIEQYREEIRISSGSPEAYLGLATAALKTHKYDEARDAAKKAVELSPSSAMAHGQYGRALVELSDLNQGIAELERAVQLAIQIPELHFALSRAYAKANRPKDAERERQIFLRLNNQTKKD